MSQPLPIVAMRSAVVFPGTSLPITAARAQTLKAIEAALRDPEHRVFAVAQRDDSDEVTPENLYMTGTIAKLSSVQRGLGGVRLVLEGEHRGVSVRVTPTDGYLVASVADAAELGPLDPKDPSFVGLHRELRERAAELATKRGVPDDAVDQMLKQITEPGQLADLVASYLDVPAADRQAILEELEVEAR